MKKPVFLTLLLAASLVGSAALADIQSPPGNRYNGVRKLGRGLSNLLYGWTEVPAQFIRVSVDQNPNAFGYTVTRGVARTLGRFGYGFYEVVTSPFPTYKGSYRTPTHTSINFDTQLGYEEFPPELGFLSSSRYCRETRY